MKARGRIGIATGNRRDAEHPIRGIRCADMHEQLQAIESIIHRRRGECGITLRLIGTPEQLAARSTIQAVIPGVLSDRVQLTGVVELVDFALVWHVVVVCHVSLGI